MKFYRAFNCTCVESHVANSELGLISVELLRSYCLDLPLHLYATEPLELRKKTLLDNCINKAVLRFSLLLTEKNIQYIRQNQNLLNLEVVTEDRKKEIDGQTVTSRQLFCWNVI